jgi:TPR repeat protein
MKLRILSGAGGENERANFFQSRLSGPVDVSETVRYSKLVADKGNPRAGCKSRFCFACGRGVSVDITEAVGYFQVSADLSCCETQYADSQRLEKSVAVSA